MVIVDALSPWTIAVAPSVPFGDGTTIAVDDLIGMLEGQGDEYDSDFNLVFLNVSGTDGWWSGVLQRKLRRTQVVACTKDEHLVLFGLACELSLFWELESALAPDVSFLHLIRCALRLLEAFSSCVSPNKFQCAAGGFPQGEDRLAWRDGRRYAKHADIEKFRYGARPEQQADALRRVADAAACLRAEHAPTAERMTSTQGLFWLAELSPVDDIPTWAADTRLFRELVPSFTRRPPRPPFTVRDDSAIAVATRILSEMVEVPTGPFVIGSEDSVLQSEPPAELVFLDLPSFRIMLDPFCNQLWYLLTGTGNQTDGDLPVTNVSLFDCVALADALTFLLRSQGIPWRIALPTEYQWEAAARGPQGFLYPWGDFFDSRRCNCEMVYGAPTRLRRFSPQGDSPFGCRDMAGNVREWTRSYAGTRGVDWQRHHADQLKQDFSPDAVSRMVIRGGSYSYDRLCVQTWVRNSQIASRRDPQTGFRLVAEAVGE